MIHAFASVFGLDWSEPEDPMDRAVAEAIATFADQFECGRKTPMTGAQRQAKYKAKKVAEASKKVTQGDAQVTQGDAQVTQGDAQVTQGDSDAERKKERKNICVPNVTHSPETGFPSVDKIVSFAETHYAGDMRPTPDFCEYFHQRMTECGWIDKNGRVLDRGRWQRELSAWWDQEKKNMVARVMTPERVQVTGSGRPNAYNVTEEDVWHVD